MNTAEDVFYSRPLNQLIEGMVKLPEPLPDFLSVNVTGVTMDSRQLQRGDLFIACFGRNHDARDFIDEAVANGVAAVLADSGGEWQGIEDRHGVPVIAVDKLAARISEIAGRFFGHPSHTLKVIGITGTNGKTSCCHFIAQSLAAREIKSGVIGTLGYGVFGSLKETQHTTPDAVMTQQALAELQREQVEAVAMEVSSVGMHQHRVQAIRFDTAVFTNLSRDHLDYHESMESYAENKRKLFSVSNLRCAVINLDDSHALSMVDAVSRDVQVCTYSLSNPSATIYAHQIDLDRRGFRAEIVTPDGSGEICCGLIGKFNVSNVLATLTTLYSYSKEFGRSDTAALFNLVSQVKPVRGRMEIIGSSDEFTCIVDYAHTPDGLQCALQAIRDHFEGNVWCVFGCGGNRDRGKRPLMGEIAARFANQLIITDDNPRKEDGEEIVRHILTGIEDQSAAKVIRDRSEAIRYAIANAASGDIVLIAGKGHENYQDIGGQKTVFSDANQARLAIQKRASGDLTQG